MNRDEWIIVGFLGVMGVSAVGWWTEGSLPALWLGTTIWSLVAEGFNMVFRRMDTLVKVVERGLDTSPG